MTEANGASNERLPIAVTATAFFGRYAVALTVVAVVGLAALLVKPGPPGWPVGVFLVATLVSMGIRMWFEVASGRTHEVRDPPERRLMFAVLIGMVVIPFFYIATPAFAFADFVLPEPLHLLGVALAVAGLVLLYRAHRDLDRYWSPSLALIDDHAIVDTGVYRHVRHPMYGALFLLTFAQACLLDNWLAGLSGLAAFATLYAVRVRREEKMMRDRFGEKWDAYAARTPRLIPGWRRR